MIGGMFVVGSSVNRMESSRARHSVRAATWQWANGAQGTEAPYRAGWFMATMRDFEIVEVFHKPMQVPPGFGLRQPSGAFHQRSAPRCCIQSGRGLPHSKTLARGCAIQGPNACANRKEALHEPGLFDGQNCVAYATQTCPIGFIVPNARNNGVEVHGHDARF